MKKILSCVATLLIFTVAFSQRNSWDGWYINPTSHFNCLNIFINIIYDVTSGPNVPTNSHWQASTTEGINNESIPDYLLDYMDLVYNKNNLHRLITRVYGESSFSNLQICGDFVVVNIKESTIMGNYTFNYYNIGKAAVDYINSHGGLSTIYGHNSIQYYDYENIGEIFFTNILIRNTSNTYGNLNEGNGCAIENFMSNETLLVLATYPNIQRIYLSMK